jgi:hypothetical protein
MEMGQDEGSSCDKIFEINYSINVKWRGKKI